MGMWFVPRSVGKALIAIGRCGNHRCATPFASGQSLIDVLIPPADRGVLNLNSQLTAHGTISASAFGGDDSLVSIQVGSGTGDSVILDIVPESHVPGRADAAFGQRIKEGMKLAGKETVTASDGTRVEIVVVEYTGDGDVEGWVVGPSFMLKVVPVSRVPGEARTKFVKGLVDVGRRSLDLVADLRRVSAAVAAVR